MVACRTQGHGNVAQSSWTAKHRHRQSTRYIINSCRECRVWSAAGNATIATTSLPTKFNQKVEGDLLFYKRSIIFHLVCRCTRWHSGAVIADKSEQTLLDTIHASWIAIFGPMEELYFDGESGLSTTSAADHLKRLGVAIKIRAPEQHAQYAERHGALLRMVMHLTEEQCVREGIMITVTMLLSQALFVLNAMTTVGDHTPYNAVLGRAPAVLPPLADTLAPEGGGDSVDGRREARVREIAVSAMTQTSALARASRAARSKSSTSAVVEYHPGDLVDYRRKTSQKDQSPWHGPVPIIRTAISDGQVILRLGDGREHPYRLQDVRHTLLILHSFFIGGFSCEHEASRCVQEYVESMRAGSVETFGLYTARAGILQVTRRTHENHKLAAAIAHTVANNLCAHDCFAVRLTRGSRRLGRYAGASHSLVLWWWPGERHRTYAELCEFGTVMLAQVIGTRLESACVLQLLFPTAPDVTIADAINRSMNADWYGDDDDPDNEQQERPPGEREPDQALADGQLTPIPEEDVDEEHLWHIVDECFDAGSDGYDREAIERVALAIMRDRTPQFYYTQADEHEHLPNYVYSPPQYDHFSRTIFMYAHYAEAGLDVALYARPHAHDEAGNAVVELAFSRGMTKVIADDENMHDDEVCVLQVFAASPLNKKTVIERDTDILTAEEMIKHKTAIEAAILEELTIWVKYGTFKRVCRKPWKQNIMTSRFVAKWKWVEDSNGTKRRIIRMRMTIRGFQDWFAHLDDNFSATATRQSQKLICSECACHPDWVMVTIDIEKAFLQGLTYKEIQQSTGEPEREILFSLPTGAAAVLRQIPGFADFDERKECLLALKPGTGTKGAPRAFNMKLSMVTRGSRCRLRPTTMDPELEIRHDNGQLVAMIAKHVDDIKVAALPKVIHEDIVPALEEVFGKLSYKERSFVNTGIRHRQLADGSVVMDQDAYIAALKPIVRPEMAGAAGSSEVTDDLAELYRSLLGAVAYALITQYWVMVYVVSLQRRSRQPLYVHVRRLNAVVRILQRSPAHLTYHAMVPNDVLEGHSDSGFTKEQESGYGIRGLNLLRHGSSRTTGNVATNTNEKIVHLLDSQCRSHKHVTRCSFSSETRAAVIAADELMAMALMQHEIKHGVLKPAEAMNMRDNGTCRITTILTIDSMSLWSAVSAQIVRVPTEKNLAVHLFWLKELLTTGSLTTLRWCDTRDVTSGCHTKGSVDRTAILNLMNGIFRFTHSVKDFRPRSKRYKYDPDERNQNHPFAHPAQKWRQMIYALYNKYSPHQLPRFDDIMKKYEGKEKELYTAMLNMHEGCAKGSCDNAELGRNVCRICGRSGHWGNECPDRALKRKGPQGQDPRPTKKARIDAKTETKTEIKIEDTKSGVAKQEYVPPPPPPKPSLASSSTKPSSSTRPPSPPAPRAVIPPWRLTSEAATRFVFKGKRDRYPLEGRRQHRAS